MRALVAFAVFVLLWLVVGAQWQHAHRCVDERTVTRSTISTGSQSRTYCVAWRSR